VKRAAPVPLPGILIGMVGALTGGCGGSSDAGLVTIGGSVAGLAAGSAVTLHDNGGDALTVRAAGPFTFPTAVPADSPYAVTVAAAPAGQTCTVAGGTGMTQSANVANVVVTCSDLAFSLGGSIQGLNASGLVLANGTDTLAVPAGATQFTFQQPVAYTSSYAVTVSVQPQGLSCSVTNGKGTMPAASLASVVVSCTDQPYSVGGTVSGLNGQGGLVLANGTDRLSVTAGASSFTLPMRVPFGSAYDVTVQSAPGGMQCSVMNGAGVMGPANVSNIAVSCAADVYTVGGSISGLSAAGLVLNDSADPLPVAAGATSFVMPGTLPAGAAYDITVQTQPAGLTCAVINGQGTVGSAPVTNISVDCAPDTYTVGGSISGLHTSGLVLVNGSDVLAVAANAMTFTLPTSLPAGSAYAITLQTHPVGVACTISNGSGIIGSSNIVDVTVSCSPGAESALHAFSGAPGDGQSPYGGLLQDRDGSLYGVTYVGGVYNVGTVFRRAPDGTVTVLHSFAGGNDGANPRKSLVRGSDGRFYGTTAYGGANGNGVVFAIDTSGNESVLYAMGSGSDAQNPYGGLLLASDGNFYGLALHGGVNGLGAVFVVTPQGSESVLYSFGAGSDGQLPFGSLVQGSDGALYGLTSAGGAYGYGMAFRLALDGTETDLHDFGAGQDGAHPYGSLVQAPGGALYGTTRDGGANSLGTVFALTVGGTESVLYSFGAGSDGANPYGGLLAASDGNFYTLTAGGGAQGAGTLVQITPAGGETVLWSFGEGSDGQYPYGGLIETSDGTLYGMTSGGGADSAGTIFSFD